MGRKLSISSKEKFTNENVAELTVCFQAIQTVELAIRSGVDVDAILRGSERLRLYEGEEDSKQGVREDTALFDSALDR